jgi:hypothetical protein
MIPPRHALLDTSQPQYCKLIALALSDQAPEKRAPFIIHVDEFQSFSTDAFASPPFGGAQIRYPFLHGEPIPSNGQVRKSAPQCSSTRRPSSSFRYEPGRARRQLALLR